MPINMMLDIFTEIHRIGPWMGLTFGALGKDTCKKKKKKKTKTEQLTS